MAAQANVAVVEASPIQTRCMSSKARRVRASQDSCASASSRGYVIRRQSDPAPEARGRRNSEDAAAPPRRSIESYVPQLSTKRLAGAGEPRLHGPDRDP